MKLTAEMERVLAIARRDGKVTAGKGEHAGHVERVSAPTIAALIKRGLLVHCYGSEGGFAGRLSPAQLEREIAKALAPKDEL